MPARHVRTGSFVAFVVVLAGAACASEPQIRQYQLQGQVLALRSEAGEVLIRHGDIKNFMPGMTMPFKVRDAGLLASKAPGDLVTATLMVGDTEAWLATLDKTSTAPLEAASTIPPASFVALLEAGHLVPTSTLTDQDDQPLLIPRPAMATVLTFIYTRCPLPQFCPMLDRRFAELHRAVRADRDLARSTLLVSVSFDPHHDTPAALRVHARKLAADPATWRFATAPAETVDRFAAAFGVNVIREADGTITHNLRTAVIGPNGHVVSVYEGGDWTPAQVADDLRRALADQ